MIDPLMMRVVACKFSCTVCGIRNATSWVPERAPDMPIEAWMGKICVPRIMQDHFMLSPGCNPETLQGLWIPDGEHGLGTRAVKEINDDKTSSS